MAQPVSNEYEIPETETPIPSLDDLIEQNLGNFGWIQFMQSVLVSLSMFFDAQQTFITIYTDSHPSWHCTDHTKCSSDSDICMLPRSAWSWNGPSSMTIISQWDIQCASSFIIGLPQSSFFFGCLFGGFLLATMADSSLGRKNLLFLSCFTMSATSIVIIVSTNVWIYSALRFLSGFCRSSIITCALVLVAEKGNKKWRFRMGLVALLSFSLGFLSLPAIAYANRGSSWRFIYLWTSIPAISYSVSAYFFVTESPRWLLMKSEQEETSAIPRSAQTEADGDTILSQFKMLPKPKASLINLFSSIKALFGKRWVTQRLLAVMAVGFGIGMVYFGMPLSVGNLGFNIYLVVMFNASLEIPSYIATLFLENCRRKVSILAFSVVSGICSILCSVIGKRVKGVTIGLELASFFGVCVAFNVLLIYITELFPTCVRNTATSMVRQAIISGAMCSPFLISAGRKNDILSYGVFGVVIMGCSFSVAFLPETKGITLCDTMDEQVQKESITL
ncbi:hypothetical protein L6164_022900 [Bauhinia variegata]|uniref:Uncharacterized protein n=1 Tax=Bauhinia variegata TaxID=167791 RepID=A0ACB9MI34_BAUVA|nr:hypothetical protein L6164_022900 [Bauhinia variegata]